MSSSQDNDNDPLHDPFKDTSFEGLFEEMEHSWEHYQDYKARYPSPGLQRIWVGITQRVGWKQRTRRFSQISSVLKYAAAILLPIITVVLGLYVARDFSASTGAKTLTQRTEQGVSTRVNLSDGSVVWLRPNSEITYSKKFDCDIREIELVGQAYFKVRTDSLWPFVVRANGFSITALGTEFIMNTNPGKAYLEAALVSGNAQIEWTDTSNEKVQQLLEPMERVVYSADERDIVEIAPLAPSEAKWNHYFMLFEGIPAEEVLAKLADAYNMQVEVDPEANLTKPITITVREESFEQVLSLLQYIVPFSYSISKDTVYISPQ